MMKTLALKISYGLSSRFFYKYQNSASYVDLKYKRGGQRILMEFIKIMIRHSQANLLKVSMLFYLTA